MKIAVIAAMGVNRAIGAGGKIPWHLPADFGHFKELTTGHPLIMGRKTFESIGKPLPGRTNIIITNQDDFKAEGCLIARSFEEALALAAAAPGGDKVFVGGGEQIYKLAFPKADIIYLTKVTDDFTGDTFFPEMNEAEWRLIATEEYKKDEKNPFDFAWLTYERV